MVETFLLRHYSKAGACLPSVRTARITGARPKRYRLGRCIGPRACGRTKSSGQRNRVHLARLRCVGGGAQQADKGQQSTINSPPQLMILILLFSPNLTPLQIHSYLHPLRKNTQGVGLGCIPVNRYTTAF